MTQNEAEKMLGMVIGLFPTTTSDQGSLIIKTFKQYRLKTVVNAIEEHARNFKFLTLTELFKACEKAERQPDAASRGSIPCQSYADVIRGLDSQLRPIESDLEVIIRSYRKQWHAAGLRNEYRETMRRQCTMALVGIPYDGAPMNQADAGRWAETIFGDTDYFRDVLDDLRNRHTSGKAPSGELLAFA